MQLEVPMLVRCSTGAGLDALFLIGLQLTFPGAEYVSLFGEGRAGLGFDATGDNERTHVIIENLGGASGNSACASASDDPLAGRLPVRSSR